MDLQEAICDKEAFREELRTKEPKQPSWRSYDLEIPEICQELKDGRTMAYAKDIETQKFGTQLREY